MAVHQGFVQQIDAGRGGLVSVHVIHADGSTGTYVIADLDADPERFNERLTKVGLLRDAMNRAEPVEIEHSPGKAGEEIDRAARISRDAIAPVQSVNQIAGMVVDLRLHSENGVIAAGETHDFAHVGILTYDLTPIALSLDMQAPERLVAQQQFEMLREAETHGRGVSLIVDNSVSTTGVADNVPRIISVSLEDDVGDSGRVSGQDLDGFVESLSLIRVPFGGTLLAHFAHVRLTTAPGFTGDGNTVGVAPFTPVTVDLLVPKNSLTYDLFEIGLRDNFRMHVRTAPQGTTAPGVQDQVIDLATTGPVENAPTPSTLDVPSTEGQTSQDISLVLGAELLAPLASASRPVWIMIARESLDHGPDGYPCTVGVPSSDLTPRSLRDLRIPYSAQWRGVGCFNKGVYRFELQIPDSFALFVDARRLCLYDSDTAGIKLAYACLCDEHEVVVDIENWVCDNDFIMDVYRIR